MTNHPKWQQLLLAVLLSSACANSGRAGDGRPDAPALFSRIDDNADGYIDREEVPAGRQTTVDRLIRRADHDGDGRLSGPEFAVALRPGPLAGPDRSAPIFGPPRPLPGERRRGGHLLRRFDQDGDGRLNAGERSDGLSALRARSADPRSPRRGKPGPRLRGRLWWAIDADADGALSAAELSAASDSLRALDHDGDGRVTGGEAGVEPFSCSARRSRNDRPKPGTDSNRDRRPR